MMRWWHFWCTVFLIAAPKKMKRLSKGNQRENISLRSIGSRRNPFQINREGVCISLDTDGSLRRCHHHDSHLSVSVACSFECITHIHHRTWGVRTPEFVPWPYPPYICYGLCLVGSKRRGSFFFFISFPRPFFPGEDESNFQWIIVRERAWPLWMFSFSRDRWVCGVFLKERTHGGVW